MRLNFQFQATQDEYLLAKIYEKVIDFSATYVSIEVKHTQFIELFRKYFGEEEVYESVSCFYSKSTNNLEPYVDRVMIAKNHKVAVKYAFNNVNDDSDATENFDYQANAIYSATNFNFFYNYDQQAQVNAMIHELKNHLVQEYFHLQ